MVKRYDSAYVPGRTGWRWVKMKEAEEALGKLSDTVDCVVMGYTAGRGKRASFGLGQFLVGVKDGEKIKTVTKVGTGLTDEQFRELKKRLLGSELTEMPKEYEVHKLLEPDFWVNPEVVVEIAADDITKSPTHTAGLALRFPRLVKFRDDKSPDQATTVEEVKKLFKLQNS
jgi:DNA ligase 1